MSTAVSSYRRGERPERSGVRWHAHAHMRTSLAQALGEEARGLVPRGVREHHQPQLRRHLRFRITSKHTHRRTRAHPNPKGGMAGDLPLQDTVCSMHPATLEVYFWGVQNKF